MELFFSSEVDQFVVLSSLHETTQRVEPVLLEKLKNSSLACLDARINYVPIIMNDEGRRQYPARSRLRLGKRMYGCCPQLDIDVFLSGSDAERIKTFVNGLRECGPALKKLGASDEQVREFDSILDQTIVLAFADSS